MDRYDYIVLKNGNAGGALLLARECRKKDRIIAMQDKASEILVKAMEEIRKLCAPEIKEKEGK